MMNLIRPVSHFGVFMQNVNILIKCQYPLYVKVAMSMYGLRQGSTGLSNSAEVSWWHWDSYFPP